MKSEEDLLFEKATDQANLAHPKGCECDEGSLTGMDCNWHLVFWGTATGKFRKKEQDKVLDQKIEETGKEISEAVKRLYYKNP